ncbi:MAG: transposase [Deltaproteobacteria bacterium]|nr:transposase [Deltaproteobacteria bacterium]
MVVTIQHILNAAYPAYAATHRQPLHVLKAVSALRRCRSGALGAHAVVCNSGHLIDVRPNSCRHRSCPQCGWRKSAQWLDQWKARLLPSTHFHVVFTLPDVLRNLWRWNRRCFADAFFAAASEALLQLLEQPRHLGARPGILMGLHTWGGALPLHPHLHCLVSAGGMDSDGRWQSTRANFLLWAPILREVFRAKLVAGLAELLRQGQLRWPPDMDELELRVLLHEAKQLTWHVRIEPPYAHGAGLVVYLARYLHGGPIKNHRLVEFSGQTVRFRYKEPRRAGRAKWRTMELPVQAFLERLFEHVPPSGLHVVRGYGLYAARERTARESARLQLQPSWLQPTPQISVTSPYTESCPHCGAALMTRPLPRAWPRSDEKPIDLRPLLSDNYISPSTANRLPHS